MRNCQSSKCRARPQSLFLMQVNNSDSLHRQALYGACFTQVILLDPERKFIVNSFSTGRIGLNSKFGNLRPRGRAPLPIIWEEKCGQII